MRNIEKALKRIKPGEGRVIVLTGAGISAESGIPTFRGPEGYWQVGSKNYHPTEMATHAAFSKMPDEVWAWYLYRRGICRNSHPNIAHDAVTDLSKELGNRFLLITQNVDGLHLRANTPIDRTYQIHGNIDFMRCSHDCATEIYPLPEAIDIDWSKGRPLSESEHQNLRCPRCNSLSRPHVLWFDESYDEHFYRFNSSLRAASAVDLLIVVGTTGGTNLPLQIGSIAVHHAEAGLIVINPEPNPFTDFAMESTGGVFLQGTAGELVPAVVKRIIEFDKNQN